MNLRRKLEQLERQHQVLNRCPKCAENGGIRVALHDEDDGPFDPSTMNCPACGAKPEHPLLVIFAASEPQSRLPVPSGRNDP